ncbi:MAG: GNAT family N-acetyltransferase [Bacillota bacterium]
MIFTKAKRENVPRIMEIVALAQAFLKGNGVVQWQNGYPTAEKIEDDIAKGQAYVVVEDCVVLAYFVLFAGYEPDYFEGCFLNPEGAWKTDGGYAVVHRVAVGEKGKGLGSAIFDFAMAKAKEMGVPAMRIDTHRDNIPMQTVLKKHGFEYCGIINVTEGERFAFEAVL